MHDVVTALLQCCGDKISYWFSEFLMKTKKVRTSKTKSKKTGKKPTTRKTKKSSNSVDDSDIIIIDDDLIIDVEKELEERKAYLEEARSQDAND